MEVFLIFVRACVIAIGIFSLGFGFRRVCGVVMVEFE